MAVANVRKAGLGEASPSSSSPFDLVGLVEVVEVGNLLQAQTQFLVPGQGEEDRRSEI